MLGLGFRVQGLLCDVEAMSLFARRTSSQKYLKRPRWFRRQQREALIRDLLLMIYIYICCNTLGTLNYGNSGIFLTRGNAGFRSSTVGCRVKGVGITSIARVQGLQTARQAHRAFSVGTCLKLYFQDGVQMQECPAYVLLCRH